MLESEEFMWTGTRRQLIRRTELRLVEGGKRK